ncbi:MAG: DnaJ domain-containing protein [Proteobacteria bacterium]|nr:DnaJ domain-containing protein [Pseudomonadota bacterium]MDA1355040.1 DnaJ domain-containing protein [Pseudomonadota bacterium]
MVKYLILGVALLVAVLLIARWFESANPSRLAKALKWGFIGLGGAVAVFLGVTGKMNLAAIPLALIFLPLLLRGMRGASAAGKSGTPSPGKQSEVETDYLRMMLDHDSGEMDGMVLRGEYQGRELRELSQAELLDLLDVCHAHDEQSARLIESYIDRVFGEEWRESENTTRSGRAARSSASPMKRDEAFEVLGLAPESSDVEIREAHRKLQLKNHPDHGGSDYLAAKINQAKEVLLGGK